MYPQWSLLRWRLKGLRQHQRERGTIHICRRRERWSRESYSEAIEHQQVEPLPKTRGHHQTYVASHRQATRWSSLSHPREEVKYNITIRASRKGAINLRSWWNAESTRTGYIGISLAITMNPEWRLISKRKCSKTYVPLSSSYPTRFTVYARGGSVNWSVSKLASHNPSLLIGVHTENANQIVFLAKMNTPLNSPWYSNITIQNGLEIMTGRYEVYIDIRIGNVDELVRKIPYAMICTAIVHKDVKLWSWMHVLIDVNQH